MKRCNAETLCVGKAESGCDLCDTAYGRDIDGANDRFPDCDISAVIRFIPVADCSAVCISKRFIFIAGGKGLAACIERRSVGGEDFKGGAGLPQRITGAV